MTFAGSGAAWFVLDVSLRALAAAAAVALVLRLLRLRAAPTVHTAWSAVLIAMLCMPVLPSVVPEVPVVIPSTAVGFLEAGFGADERWASVTEDATPAPTVAAAARAAGDSQPQRTTDPHPSAAIDAQPSRSWIALALLGVYAAGVLLLLSRLLYGWHLASAMIRRARRRDPVRVGATRVYESSEVTVPMTVGVIRPLIVLPAAWKTWDAETLNAVVAHEAAHVRRHDTAIIFAAHLNRAIFWFHPLAWWLERKLAVTAEHACDEAAARAIGAPDRYAEILVDMADVVRRNRGRFAWQGVGVDGAGHLDGRIDRLLRGDAFAMASTAKKIAAAVGCVLALTTAIACRQQISATPLREDPELAKRMVEQATQTKRFEAARDMTQAEADTLEQRVALKPEDFDARERLVFYYATSSNVAWDKKVPGLRRHALWLIEHHPEHDVRAPALSPQFDPEGFAAAKKLWETHLGKPDASAFLVYRAASFFAPNDKPYAEQLILRGMAMDPESAALKARMAPNVGGYQWPSQLASLYASALRGSESVWGTYNDLRTHLDWLKSPYVTEVRRKLDETTDARLLANVGSLLSRPSPPQKDPAMNQAVAEMRALGTRYLERALQLNPTLVNAKSTLVRMRLAESATDADRLADRAFAGYMSAEDITEYAKKDPAAGKQRRVEAKAQAEEVLKIAATHAGDPAYSAAIMIAHHVLATEALRDGDRERAIHHLRESVKVPASERIQYALTGSWSRPVTRLLKEGERDRVAEFLEALAALSIVDRDYLLGYAKAIREGRMPASFQETVAREGKS